ncbi:branched-chain amino acid ABC transporter permease [Paracoccus sp. APAP_BH8]|uniref:Branched-chain amino acid ABC transporter permease n=2 Tax=Paracoccaceae TaxID=31989 RepID=A0A7H9BZU1_PARPN|nr:branched-chain amino acid ABC transporter permease [Paracoccus pantotrophus]QLH15351.1 branched-chain amino acid ABC transporter permease [Paracoccus pantotrophus]RDD96999.1 branched-chain amino acid ABC transporter permease [Paracoccus pantotrophus]RNI20808.1 branched-chain amino acid ABC transporter permease [Paracoccus pantotrophus]WGR65488.1 branched-chain amino acid ABC transporter permease [Paracoccus pantotrophus]
MSMNPLDKPYAQLALALLTVLVLPLFLKSGILATEILIFAMVVAACNLLLGYTGLLSFGQGIFFGIGTYVAGICLTRWSVPVPLVLAGAAVLGAATATLVGWLSIRRQGVYFVMLTLAFSQLFYFVAYTFSGVTGGDNGLLGVPRPLVGGTVLNAPWSYYTFVAICFVAVFAVLVMVTQSTFGRTLLAIRENEGRAAAIGFPTRLFKIEAFAISGAVTAFGGALHAMLIGVAPLSNIEYHTSELILIMTIIGGSSSLFGSVLGAGFYLLLADALSTVWPRWLLLLGLVLVTVALFLQRGLWGLVERGYDLVFRRERAPETPAEEH